MAAGKPECGRTVTATVVTVTPAGVTGDGYAIRSLISIASCAIKT